MEHKLCVFKIKQVITIFLIFISCISRGMAQGTNFPPDQNAYSVQMHLHGMSNHNGHNNPGSLQWHTFFADTSGTDVLWWSDHISVYNQNKKAEFTFANGVYDSTLDAILGLSGSNSLPVKWQMASNNGGIKGIYFNDTTLALSIKSVSPLSTNRKYTAKPVGAQGKLKDTKTFVRPLISNPSFQFNLKPLYLNHSGHNKIQLTITLDYHHYNGTSKSQSIIYNFVAPPAVYSQQLTDSFTVMVNVPVTPNTVNFLSLNLMQSASLLRDYKDNCTSDYQIAVYASQGDSVRAEFSRMKITSAIQAPTTIYKAINTLAKSYVIPYGVGEYVGTEYSANGYEQHINAFIPESLPNKYILYKDSNFTAGEYISRIHSFNGAASYNHPFGIDVNINPAYDSTELDSFALIYLSNQFFGADVLEVGYVRRGGFNMEGHFSLWDKLTANKVFIYGNATSDAHGGNWYTYVNHWVTFIWANDSATQNLITGMKTGRLYGADNLVYNGRFDFHIANAAMGDRKAADTTHAPVIIDMENILPGSVFKYTQGVIQDGLQVNYLHHNAIMDPANPPVLDLTLPSFTRIVVYDSTGKEYLFSNPIVFIEPTEVNKNKNSGIQQSSLKLNVPYNEYTGKNEAMLFSNHDQTITLEVFEAGGKLVCKQNGKQVYSGNNNVTLTCGNLRPGMYVLKAYSNTGMSAKSFIVPPINTYFFKCQH